MSDLAVVYAMAEAWKRWRASSHFPFERNGCCINSARVTTRALDKFGVASRPVSVKLLLWNQLAWQHFSLGIPIDQWPKEAWSLGVAEHGNDIHPKDWNGHLIVEGEGWTMDPSAQMFDRPGKITVPGPWVFEAQIPADDRMVCNDEHGQILVLERWVQNNAWRVAPGWTRLHEREVPMLVDITNKVLEGVRDE